MAKLLGWNDDQPGKKHDGWDIQWGTIGWLILFFFAVIWWYEGGPEGVVRILYSIQQNVFDPIKYRVSP